MKTKFTLLFTVLLIAGFTLFYGCEEIYKPITISGQVVESNSQSPVENATVSIVTPEDLARETFSDGSGNYVFEEVPVDSVIDLTIQVEKEGFSTESVTVLAAPERELVVPKLRVKDQNSGDDGTVEGAIGGAAKIELENISSQSLRITETGGLGNSTVTFVVLDSTGRAIDSNHAVDVEFLITGGPNGGEAITPEIVQSDDNGLVTTNIFAGTIAGNLKIQAKAERTDIGLTIISAPITLTIHGGFPDLAHFSIAPEILNFEGFVINGNEDPIHVIVGDKYSNPVKEGTPVYFDTGGGVIVGSDITDSEGRATVNLISGNPRPPSGYFTVRAHTFNEMNEKIARETTVLFSGPPSTVNIRVSPSTFDIPADEGVRFEMILTDINGNPLPYNTRVSVTPSEGMSVSGNTNFTIPNARFAGPGVTEFEFTAQDSDEESSVRQEVSIFIEVETPGGYKASKTISGFKAKAF